MKNCPFCDEKITESQSVYETETVNVLHNIRPGKNRGRCIVIPKRHVENLGQLTKDEAEDLFGVVWEVSNKLREALRPIAINYGFNEGEFAGQFVEHFHFHIMPRFKDDEMPEFHLFHRPSGKKKNLTLEEVGKFAKEFRDILSK